MHPRTVRPRWGRAGCTESQHRKELESRCDPPGLVWEGARLLTGLCAVLGRRFAQTRRCCSEWLSREELGSRKLPPFAQRPKAGSSACLHRNHLLGLWAGPGLCWDGAWASALRTKSSGDLCLQGRGCQAPSPTGASQPSLEFAAWPQCQHQGRGAVRGQWQRLGQTLHPNVASPIQKHPQHTQAAGSACRGAGVSS